jgi:phosphatidylglycerol:prolipoprotein diacylglycerol transferase
MPASVALSAVQGIPELDPGMLWITGLLAGLAYAVRSARLAGLDARAMYWASVCAVFGGVWGGHVLVVLYEPGAEGLAFLRVWLGGKSFYGGLFGGALAALLYLRMRRLPIAAYADAGIPGVALGYAIGRVGCFVNGDDYGTPSNLPWAVQFPAGTEAHAAHLARGWINDPAAWSLPVHPTQLYAALLGLLLFLVLTQRHWRAPASRVCFFAIAYGTARFFLEWLRGDWQVGLGPLSLPQLFSLFLVLVGVITWVAAWRPAWSAARADSLAA